MMNSNKIMSERIEGPTPSGGAYAIGYFMNDEGIAVSKEEATQIIIKEYNDKDIVIKTTHGGFTQPKQKNSDNVAFML